MTVSRSARTLGLGSFARDRFPQGNRVDRGRPHIFHRDYWTLRHIVEAVDGFLVRARPRAGARVLDYGAGDSPYQGLLEQRGVIVTRADIGPARSNVLRIDHDGVIDADTGTFDFVISTQVLEHVPSVQVYLSEAFRVLRPGGRLLLTTHGNFIVHRMPNDYRRWTSDGLELEAAGVGFRVDRVDPRIGPLASTTHIRSILAGGFVQRLPGLSFLRVPIYLLSNLKMWIEDRVMPEEWMGSNPELLVLEATKRDQAEAVPDV